MGQYCSSDDENVIESGIQTIKRILTDNFVRPDESQKILSQLRKKEHILLLIWLQFAWILKKLFSEKFDRLLCGGIWCIVQLEYEVEGDSKFGIIDNNDDFIVAKQKKTT